MNVWWGKKAFLEKQIQLRRKTGAAQGDGLQAELSLGDQMAAAAPVALGRWIQP